MLEQRNVLRFLEPLAGERRQPVHVAAAVRQRSAHADLEPLLEVDEIDLPVQLLVVQLVEDGSPDLVRFQGDPVERWQFVFRLYFAFEGHVTVGTVHDTSHVHESTGTSRWRWNE